MEIVFVRPSMQPRNFFQGHGESVQKSGYLQEERVDCLRTAAAAEARFKSVSQWMSWERHSHAERVLFVIFSFLFPDFVYCNILLDFQWINLYNSYYYESCYMNGYPHLHQQHHPGIQTFLSVCWCDFSNGGWMAPCQSSVDTWFPCAEATRTEAIMTVTCQWLLLTNTTINQ